MDLEEFNHKAKEIFENKVVPQIIKAKMKQTAVDWLLENLISEPHSEEDFKYNSECWDKAKAMEKEQIMDAYTADCDTLEHTNSFNVAAEQYYNKTFKSE
jgi:hypothetical protein